MIQKYIAKDSISRDKIKDIRMSEYQNKVLRQNIIKSAKNRSNDFKRISNKYKLLSKSI